ncbi:hypothetical protein FRC01_004662 [Tulasnella sp. 417]|nr:hypothetical protein FRC01_004662 [Tulasnella sp. 417]
MSLNISERSVMEKHPSLWFDDGNLVIKVKGHPSHFNLYRGRCRKASGLINVMVPAEPQPPQTNLTTDTNTTQDQFQETNKGVPSDPLELSCTFEEFELAAAWMIGELERPVSLEQWLLLLEASDYLEIPRLAEEAIAELSPLVSSKLRPAHTLSLARRYRVDSWLQPSLTGFLSTPPLSLTAEDLHLASEETVLSYIRLHHSSNAFRMALILWPPSLAHDASCFDDTQQRCKAAFRNWWHSEISTLLIKHQTLGELPSVTYKRVKARLEIASYAALAAVDDPDFRDKVIHGMTRRCSADGLRGCLQFEALTKESDELEKAVNKLLAKDSGESGKPEPLIIDANMDEDMPGDVA